MDNVVKHRIGGTLAVATISDLYPRQVTVDGSDSSGTVNITNWNGQVNAVAPAGTIILDASLGDVGGGTVTAVT